jgi:hypothetical protein
MSTNHFALGYSGLFEQQEFWQVPVPSIPGLQYIPDFITPVEEAFLVSTIDDQP